MKRTLMGIGITTVVLYIWGSLFWGLSPLPYESLHSVANDAATQQLLRQQFPDSGTYLVPGRNHPPEALEQLSRAGPLATIHIRLQGTPVTDVSVLAGGFVLNLVFVAMLAGFFHVAKAREFADFARLSMIVGAIAVVLIDGGDIIWWQETIGWKLWIATYNFTAFLLSGHLLGIFLKQPKVPSQ